MPSRRRVFPFGYEDPNLTEILQRLATNDNRDALVKAADDLNTFVNHNSAGEIFLSEEIGWELDTVMEPFLDAAKLDIEKRLSLGPDVVRAWGFIGKAGVNLVDLDRPDSFGDGRRAYLIIGTFVERTIRHLYSCSNDDDFPVYMYCYDFAYLRYSRAIDYMSVHAAYKEQMDGPLPSAEQVEAYDDDMNRVMWETIEGMEGPYAAAVKKVRREGGRGKKRLAEAADAAELALTKLLSAVARHGFRRNDEMGFDLFEDARREMNAWHAAACK